jgi:hypothetical protein
VTDRALDVVTDHVWLVNVAHAGDKRGGSAHVLYDTTYSRRGALLPVAKAPRVANPFDLGLSLVIKNPHALPMYREDPGRKRGRDKSRNVSPAGRVQLHYCVAMVTTALRLRLACVLQLSAVVFKYEVQLAQPCCLSYCWRCAGGDTRWVCAGLLVVCQYYSASSVLTVELLRCPPVQQAGFSRACRPRI